MFKLVYSCLALATAATATAGETAAGCEAQDGQRPVCSFQNPEDLAPLPGGEALLVSEYGAMEGGRSGGLALFDLIRDERHTLFRGGDAQGPARAGWGDPTCPSPPPADFSPHGIDLARRNDGALVLAVVQHGTRESIELFEVLERAEEADEAGAQGAPTPAWTVEWRGCVIPPEGAWLNEVLVLRDGSLMTSHMMPRVSEEALFEARAPGWVWRWTPDGGFEQVAGASARLANGIELSPDETTLFLNSSMGDGLQRIDLASGEVTGRATLGSLDNSTWAPDGKLLVALLLAEDEESFAVCSALKSGPCPIPFQIVAVDPETMETAVRFDSRGSPMGAGTVGLQVGDELFIGSFAGDRILRVDLDAVATAP
jgi:hypothetical protein